MSLICSVKFPLHLCSDLKFISPLILISTPLWVSKIYRFSCSPSAIISFYVIGPTHKVSSLNDSTFAVCFATLFSILFIFTACISFLLCKFACFSFLALSAFAVTRHHIWSTILLSSVTSRSSRILTDVHHMPVKGIPQPINGRISKSVQKPAYLTVLPASNDCEKATFSIAA